MTLTLGFSPCPNDTFIFDAMVNGKIDTRGLRFEPVLEDVETLNLWAAQGKLQVTKLSFNSLLQNVHRYALLHSGSALGKGVGPLLIRNPGFSTPNLAEARIAIPGINTTANLLLSLAHPEARNKTEVLFSEIEEALLRGDFDAGLVIHESRFTYAQKGLELIEDMGDWWERHAGAAIPLGGIAVRRDLDHETCQALDAVIRESVQYAWAKYPELPPYVTSHAQEMDEDVMRRHIELYVNEYTEELGLEGSRAIEVLFQKAAEAGLIPRQGIAHIFY
jgi:1,4-dihydroxy-6-naphthoate synthase